MFVAENTVTTKDDDTAAVARDARGTRDTVDSGRVKMGAGAIRFTNNHAQTKDAGRVTLGAGAIRFASDVGTKDAGRVRMGAGAIRF